MEAITPNHKELFLAHKTELTESADALSKKRYTIKQLQMKISELQTEIEKMEATRREVITPEESRAIQIKWPVFLDYVSSREGRKAWICTGWGHISKNRTYCPNPRCKRGNHGGIGDAIIDKYALPTLVYTWRTCRECLDCRYIRDLMISCVQEPDHPVVHDDFMVRVDPYIYKDIAVTQKLLGLAGIDV